MLDALRKGAGSWLAKIFIALLVLSFAIWGIADIFRGFRAQVLARVGDKEIGAEQFRDAYEREIAALSSRIGRQITSAEAQALGLRQRVLERLIAGAAIDAHASELGLGVSSEAIAETIRNDPIFHGPSGKFSKITFEQLLRANGLTEAGFVARQRNELIRAQLLETLSQSAAVPKVLIDSANRYQNETRVLEYFVLPISAAGELPKPDSAALKDYYESHIGQFTAPEYRKVGILGVSPETLTKTIEISPEDLRAAYEVEKEKFIEPERREIEQIIFQDMATAQAAYEKLTGGADFMEVAKAQGMSEADVKLGLVTKKAMPDQKIAEAAFNLKKGEISKPVEGDFSIVILRVSDIKPGSSKSFEDVKEQLRKELSKQRASEELFDFHDKIEDERAAGTTLEEIAKKFNLEYTTVTLDRRGKTPEGKPAPFPRSQDFPSAVFESDVGVENDPVETAEGGYLWFEILQIIPEQKKPFADVREEVEKAWRADELKAALRQKAEELVEKARAGTPLSELAKSVGAELKTSDPLKRQGSSAGLPAAAIAKAFTLPEGEVESTVTEDGSSRVLFKVVKVEPPKAVEPALAEKLREALKSSMDEDLAVQYIAALRKRFGVEINNEALTRLFGS